MFTHRQILIYIHRSAAHMRGNKRSRADASGGGESGQTAANMLQLTAEEGCNSEGHAAAHESRKTKRF